MDELARRLHAICDAQPFATAWFVEDLTPGREADRDGRLPAARPRSWPSARWRRWSSASTASG